MKLEDLGVTVGGLLGGQLGYFWDYWDTSRGIILGQLGYFWD